MMGASPPCFSFFPSGLIVETLLKIVQVLVPIFLGLAFRLAGIFGDKESDVLRRFVVRLAVPVLIFFSMYEAKRETVSALPRMMIAFVLISVALFFLGWLISRVADRVGQRTAIHACATFGNYGWMGFGVCQVLLGQEGLQKAVFFILLWWPVFYGIGIPIGLLHAHERKGKLPLAKALKVALPVLGAMGLGLIFNFARIEMPELVIKTIKPFGDMTVPLILFSVGLMLDFSRVHESISPALLVSAVTLLAAPLIGWGVASLVAEDPVSYGVIIIEAAMPVATLTPVLAENYDMDLNTTGTCIVISTVLSMITVPVVGMLVVG